LFSVANCIVYIFQKDVFYVVLYSCEVAMSGALIVMALFELRKV
jgi:hypothetical protein